MEGLRRTQRPRGQWSVCVCVVLSAVTVTTAAQAMKVRAVELDDMVAQADRIFVGTCVEARSEMDVKHGIVSTLYAFTVSRPIKGNLGLTLTFRQYGGQVAKRRTVVHGLPAYAPGQEVVLFLHPDSDWGLTSPVGIFQGCYAVITEGDGRRVVLNSPYAQHLSGEELSRTARALSKPARLTTEGRMELGDFVALVDGMVKDGEQAK